MTSQCCVVSSNLHSKLDRYPVLIHVLTWIAWTACVTSLRLAWLNVAVSTVGLATTASDVSPFKTLLHLLECSLWWLNGEWCCFWVVVDVLFWFGEDYGDVELTKDEDDSGLFVSTTITIPDGVIVFNTRYNHIFVSTHNSTLFTDFASTIFNLYRAVLWI